MRLYYIITVQNTIVSQNQFIVFCILHYLLYRSDATFLAILESMELNAPSTWLVKNVRQYEAIIPNPIREIIWNDGTYIVQEEYTSAGFTVETIKVCIIK